MTATHYLFAVSDTTGRTAERVLRAALVQFGHPEGVEIRRFSRVNTPEKVLEVVREAARVRAFVVYTLPDLRLRRTMHRALLQYGLRGVDLLGTLLMELGAYLEAPPRVPVGPLQPVDESYFQRIEAVEFTVQHDDGRNPAGLWEAQIVLVGVSRTSKTPLSMYLAHRGWKVANVPIVLNVPPPPQLFEIDPGRVVGLTINPYELARIREARLRALGEPGAHARAYADLNHVREELRYAREIFRQGGWPVVDVTGKAVEETAVEVLSLVGLQASPEDRTG